MEIYKVKSSQILLSQFNNESLKKKQIIHRSQLNFVTVDDRVRQKTRIFKRSRKNELTDKDYILLEDNEIQNLDRVFAKVKRLWPYKWKSTEKPEKKGITQTKEESQFTHKKFQANIRLNYLQQKQRISKDEKLKKQLDQGQKKVIDYSKIMLRPHDSQILDILGEGYRHQAQTEISDNQSVKEEKQPESDEESVINVNQTILDFKQSQNNLIRRSNRKDYQLRLNQSSNEIKHVRAGNSSSVLNRTLSNFSQSFLNWTNIIEQGKDDDDKEFGNFARKTNISMINNKPGKPYIKVLSLQQQIDQNTENKRLRHEKIKNEMQNQFNETSAKSKLQKVIENQQKDDYMNETIQTSTASRLSKKIDIFMLPQHGESFMTSKRANTSHDDRNTLMDNRLSQFSTQPRNQNLSILRTQPDKHGDVLEYQSNQHQHHQNHNNFQNQNQIQNFQQQQQKPHSQKQIKNQNFDKSQMNNTYIKKFGTELKDQNQTKQFQTILLNNFLNDSNILNTTSDYYPMGDNRKGRGDNQEIRDQQNIFETFDIGISSKNRKFSSQSFTFNDGVKNANPNKSRQQNSDKLKVQKVDLDKQLIQIKKDAEQREVKQVEHFRDLVQKSFYKEKGIIEDCRQFMLLQEQKNQEFLNIMRTVERDRPVTQQLRRKNFSPDIISQNQLRFAKQLSEQQRLNRADMIQHDVDWYKGLVKRIALFCDQQQKVSICHLMLNEIKCVLEDTYQLKKGHIINILEIVEREKKYVYSKSSIILIKDIFKYLDIHPSELDRFRKLQQSYVQFSQINLNPIELDQQDSIDTLIPQSKNFEGNFDEEILLNLQEFSQMK